MAKEKIFVGRSKELKFIESVLSDKSNKIVFIEGDSGVGKTELLAEVEKLSKKLGFQATSTINFEELSSRQPIAIIQKLISNLNKKEFPETTTLIEEIQQSDDEQKLLLKKQLITIFVQEYHDTSQLVSSLLMFDTCETIINTEIEDFIKKMVIELGETSVIFMAGQKLLPLGTMIEMEVLKLEPFRMKEIKELAINIFEQDTKNMHLSNDELEFVFQTSGGDPIFTAIILEWMRDEGTIVDNLSSSRFEIVVDFVLKNKRFDANHKIIINLMAAIDKRFNLEILTTLISLDDADIKLNELSEYAFVKNKINEDGYQLHSKFKEALILHGNLPQSLINQYRLEIVNKYYNPLLLQEESRINKQIFSLEKLYYLNLITAQKKIALDFFRKEFEEAIDNYEYDYCANLLSKMIDAPLSPSDMLWVTLLEGEFLLKKYNSLDAVEKFDKVCQAARIVDDESLLSRALEGVSSCITQGAEKGEVGINRAIEKLREALEWVNDGHREAKIYYALGNAHEMLGKHVDAEQYYKNSITFAREADDNLTISRNLDRLSEIARRSGDLDAGLRFAKEGLDVRLKLNNSKELANSYRFLALAYRDIKETKTAQEYYDKAIMIYEDIGDKYSVAEILGSIAMMSFRQSNLPKAKKYVNLAIELENEIGYHKELGWDMHTLLEIAITENRSSEELYGICDQALALSKEYGQVFMILDLLSHRAEIDFSAGDYNHLQEYLSEVDAYLAKGCRYRFFKGRILKIIGDSLYEQKKYDDAFRYYGKAYHIFAQAQSFAYRDNFKGLLENHLKIKFAGLSKQEFGKQSDILFEYWNDNELEKKFPTLIAMIQSIKI